MARQKELSKDTIALEKIGQLREADILNASIRRKLGLMSLGALGAELVTDPLLL